MSKLWVECWKCDECGFRWIKSDILPERCASSKCRKRSWNKSDAPTVMRRYVRKSPDLVEIAPLAQGEGAGGSIPLTDSKINMDALRDIAAGRLTRAQTMFSDSIAPYKPPYVADVPTCSKTWWEDGNQYECLMDKGHRDQKHGLRGMVRRLED